MQYYKIIIKVIFLVIDFWKLDKKKQKKKNKKKNKQKKNKKKNNTKTQQLMSGFETAPRAWEANIHVWTIELQTQIPCIAEEKKINSVNMLSVSVNK